MAMFRPTCNSFDPAILERQIRKIFIMSIRQFDPIKIIGRNDPQTEIMTDPLWEEDEPGGHDGRCLQSARQRIF